MLTGLAHITLYSSVWTLVLYTSASKELYSIDSLSESITVFIFFYEKSIIQFYFVDGLISVFSGHSTRGCNPLLTVFLQI